MSTPSTTQFNDVISSKPNVSIRTEPSGSNGVTVYGVGEQWHVVPGLDGGIMAVIRPSLLTIDDKMGERVKTAVTATSMRTRFGSAALVCARVVGDTFSTSAKAEQSSHALEQAVRARLGVVAAILTPFAAVADQPTQEALDLLVDVTGPQQND